jgi:hypothetical protein
MVGEFVTVKPMSGAESAGPGSVTLIVYAPAIAVCNTAKLAVTVPTEFMEQLVAANSPGPPGEVIILSVHARVEPVANPPPVIITRKPAPAVP